MAKIGTWSTTAGNNNATPPDGWPEGQAPSTINDCAREMMASLRTYINNAEYIDLGNTPSFLTATTFSMATADATNFEIGRRLKLFDAVTLYGTVISVSATQVAVRLDSGALTAQLSSVAVGVIKQTNNSLPDGVFRAANVIINGAFDVWQRGATFNGVTNDTYIADRFIYETVTSASVNITRSERSANASNVPTLAQCGQILTNALLVSVSAVDASIAAGDYAMLNYRMEGYDWRQIAHKPLGLAFWVNTNKSGIYACAMRSGNVSASYVQNFTVSAVNAWTRFFLTFPEAPTSPYNWNYSGSTGMVLSFVLAAGSNFQCSASAWTAQNALATSSQVNFLANAGNVFAITGITLHEGLADTPTYPRLAATEFHACQRYYETGVSSFQFLPTSGGQIFRASVQFTVDKRVAPTVTLTLTAGGAVNLQLSTAVNANSCKFDHNIVASLAGSECVVDNATFIADAEL